MKEEDLMTSWDIPGAMWGKPEDFSKVSGKNLKVGVAERNSNIQRWLNRDAHGETRFEFYDFSPIFARHHAPPAPASVRSQSLESTVGNNCVCGCEVKYPGEWKGDPDPDNEVVNLIFQNVNLNTPPYTPTPSPSKPMEAYNLTGLRWLLSIWSS